jgi:hypothetical protein
MPISWHAFALAAHRVMQAILKIVASAILHGCRSCCNTGSASLWHLRSGCMYFYHDMLQLGIFARGQAHEQLGFGHVAVYFVIMCIRVLAGHHKEVQHECCRCGSAAKVEA